MNISQRTIDEVKAVSEHQHEMYLKEQAEKEKLSLQEWMRIFSDWRGSLYGHPGYRGSDGEKMDEIIVEKLKKIMKETL